MGNSTGNAMGVLSQRVCTAERCTFCKKATKLEYQLKCTQLQRFTMHGVHLGKNIHCGVREQAMSTA